ncbi:hypothetical protein [Crocosphaera sp.]|uniref:hypothetical protein n=1 Tax=Crocosphaera sp. TaxID=2729996 RepID=UPI003F22B2E9|nr:hypothetical protein [Crocosphaera sp.]
MSGNTNRSIWWVSFPQVILTTAAIIILTKLTIFLKPFRWYFSFAALLYQHGDVIGIPAIIIKFSIPIIVGIFLGIFLKKNPYGTAICAGFLSTILLIWPTLWFWGDIMPYELQNKKLAFQVIFCFYVLSYTCLSAVGANIGKSVINWYKSHQGISIRNSLKPLTITIVKEVTNWQGTLKPTILGVISSVLFTGLTKVFLSPD